MQSTDLLSDEKWWLVPVLDGDMGFSLPCGAFSLLCEGDEAKKAVLKASLEER